MEGTPATAAASSLVRTTAWARSVGTPLRAFLRTETGGAAVLLAARWRRSCGRTWTSRRTSGVGHRALVRARRRHGSAHDLRNWVNSGLMTLFFLVVGLELRREFDIGELRERRRLALPMLAGFGGMAVPIAIYLAFNAGRPPRRGLGRGDVHRHGVRARRAGPLRAALLGRLRGFLLTVAVVDDVVAIAVHRPSRTRASSSLSALLVAAGDLRRRPARPGRWVCGSGLVYALLGVAAWVAVSSPGSTRSWWVW